MQHEIKLLFNPTLPRRAAFAYCRKAHGSLFITSIALLILGVSRIIGRNNPDWVDGTILALLGVYALLVPIAYLRHYRDSLQKLRNMDKPEATLTADEASITFASSLATITMPWATIKEIWKFEDFWLFVYYNSSYNTIPLAAVPAEQRQFLIDCVEKHGGKVS